MAETTDPRPRWRWDLFCRVVDNFGDAGVCWRLAADLATRGHAVRLWIDDATPLRWMAPAGHPGVEVRAWPPEDAGSGAGSDAGPGAEAGPGDVVVEAFGCDPPASFVAAMARAAADRARAPVWINLEYLSAEDYVERSHGLRSPRMSEPGRGLGKWFFYPGFTDATGGLLREPGLVESLDAFARLERDTWLGRHGLALAPGERLATVFCYPDTDLRLFLDGLAGTGESWCLATSPGAATPLAEALVAPARPAGLRVHALPFLTQPDYDRLLACADLNFVRGEDSFVRAQWAARPFVWQAYRQDDGVHADKLRAFLDRLRTGSGLAADDAAWRGWEAWHLAWNGLAAGSAIPPAWTPVLRERVAGAARHWRAHLLGSPDLASRLLAFIDERR